MVRFRGCLKRLGSNLTEGGVPWSGDGTQMTSVIWEVVMRVNKSTPMPFTLTDPRRTFLISTHWKPPGPGSGSFPWLPVHGGEPQAEPGPPSWDCFLRQLVGAEQCRLNKTVS